MERNVLKAVGASTGLIIFNIGLMKLLALTPAASLMILAFATPFLGIIVYGAILTIGNGLAESGIKKGNVSLAVVGVAILQFAYGSFGAGLLKIFNLPLNIEVIALGATAAATTLIAVLAAALVYGTDRDFSRWNWYSTGFFIGVMVFGFIGTFYTPALLLAFISALLGFIVYLVHEIWTMKQKPGRPLLNAVGIYVAFMGVFIQILQIVLRLLSRE